MDEKNGKNPILALTVATVLFAALGVIVYTQAPYRGVRPSVQEIQEPSEQIRARVWQDPFQAVLDHIKAREAQGKQDRVAPRHDVTNDIDTKPPHSQKETRHESSVAQEDTIRDSNEKSAEYPLWLG